MNHEVAEAEVIVLDECPRQADDAAELAQPDRDARRQRSRNRSMLWIASAVVVLSFLFEVRSDQRVVLTGLAGLPLPESCMSRSLFGFHCPGCGLTRSFVHLAHGRWQESLAVHRMGWALALAILLQFPYRIVGLRRPSGLPLGRRIPQWFGYGLIGLLIGNWLFDLIVRGAGG